MQSKKMSLFETVSNTLVGFWLAVLTNMLLFPLFGLPAPFAQSCWIAMVFTILSIFRGYYMRRFFNWMYVNHPNLEKDIQAWMHQVSQRIRTLRMR